MSSQAPKVDFGSKVVFLVSAVAILLVVYILLNSLVNTYQRNSVKGEVDTSYLVEAASDNLKPIGASSVSGAVATAASAGRGGKEIYDAVCTACHATGVLDSPKLGDNAAWEKRAAGGLDALLASATNGKGSMPAKGGDPSLSDAEVKAVVLYMTKEAGLNLGGGAAAPKAKKEAAPKAEVAAEPKKEEKKAETASAPAEPVTPTTPAEPAAPAVAPAPAAPAVAKAAAPAEDGKKVYDGSCFACHATGVAGSPKFGDKEAWAPRIATGMDALYNTALHGKGAMPPKGGNTSLSDEKVKAAVDYMVSQAK